MAYYCLEVGHILPGVTPENIGEVSPSDLLGATLLYDAKYRNE